MELSLQKRLWLTQSLIGKSIKCSMKFPDGSIKRKLVASHIKGATYQGERISIFDERHHYTHIKTEVVYEHLLTRQKRITFPALVSFDGLSLEEVTLTYQFITHKNR